MTKTIMIISIVPGLMLIVGVILSFFAPKKISVQSVNFVNASRQQVFDQIRFMKNFPNWSPFLIQDPQQKFSISGIDGQVGATFSWEGVGEKSKGSQTVVYLSGNDNLTIQCNITEPFQSSPVFAYTLKDKNGGVEIIQNFEAPMPFPSNVFGLLFGVKNRMALTNQQGLELLKKVAEQSETAMSVIK